MMTSDFFLHIYSPGAWILSGIIACVTTLGPIYRREVTEDTILLRWSQVCSLLMILAILYNALTLNVDVAVFCIISALLQFWVFVLVTALLIAITQPDMREYRDWDDAMPGGFIEANVRAAIRKEFSRCRRYR